MITHWLPFAAARFPHLLISVTFSFSFAWFPLAANKRSLNSKFENMIVVWFT